MNGWKKNYIRRFSNRIKRSKPYKSTRKIIRDHGADIFSVLAGIGVIATGVSAYNAGKNAEHESDFKYAESKLGKRYLLRPILFGTGTIGCIGAARYFGLKKEESLLAACAVLASYSGRKKDAEVSELVNEPRSITTSDIEDTGTGDVFFIEDFTGRKFKASWECYEHAKQQLQYRFSVAGFVTLNDFYELLGLQETAAGEVLGWTIDQMIMDPFYVGKDDAIYYDDALTHIGIEEDDGPDDSKIIYYCILPVGSLAGIGPCNY